MYAGDRVLGGILSAGSPDLGLDPQGLHLSGDPALIKAFWPLGSPMAP